MGYAWKQTRFQPSFLKAVAGLITPRERRFLLGLLVLMVSMAMLVLLALYYYFVTGFPWHLIACGVTLVAGSVYGWRARRSAQESAEPQHGAASPSKRETGTSRAPNLER